MLENLNILELCLFFSKRRGLEHPDDQSNKFLKILEMGARSSRKHEIDFCNIGALEVRNQEISKPRKFETKKLRNQGTKKPRNQ